MKTATVFRSGEFLSPVPRGVARQSVNVKLYFHALQICNVVFFLEGKARRVVVVSGQC